MGFLDYDVEIRKIICSTNAIESLNAHYRRAVRARGHLLTAAEHADLGVVGRADENRASRAVVIVMVAPWSAGWRWGPAIEAPDVGTVAAGRGRAGTRRGVIVSRRGPRRAARG